MNNTTVNHDYMLDCVRMSTSIRRARKMLLAEAKENGLYENFGSYEIRLIQDKYVNISDYSSEMNDKRNEIKAFSDWCKYVTREEIEQQ